MNTPFHNKPPSPPQSAEMDQILNQVIQASRLARELESTLPHIANNPNVLLASCEQVSFAFNKAVYDLRGFLSASSSSFDPAGHLIVGETSSQRLIDDWSPLHVPDSMPTGQMGFSQLGFDIQATAAITEREFIAVGGGGSFAGGEHRHAAGAMREAEGEAGGRLRGPSTGQRTSRRRESGESHTVRIPALRAGNLELPPDDGYTWRKYGQKVILGSTFPRSYFRCTHKNFYGCKAKRKVQRLDADPSMYEITYCGSHTCHSSPTPLILSSITPTCTENMTANTAGMIGASPSAAVSLPTSIELSSWFLKENESEGKTFFRSLLSSHEVGESSRGHVGPSEQPQPVRTAGRDGEGSVADLADVMFNSGSSSNNSMDTIFTFKADD